MRTLVIALVTAGQLMLLSPARAQHPGEYVVRTSPPSEVGARRLALQYDIERLKQERAATYPRWDRGSP